MKTYWKLAAGLLINVIFAYLVFERLNGTEERVFQLALKNRGSILLAFIPILVTMLCSSLRLRSQLHLQNIDIHFFDVFRVTYVSFFIIQIVNVTGLLEVVRFIMIDGKRGQLVKTLISDKVVNYTAKITFLLTLFYFPFGLLFLVLLHPRFHKQVPSVLYSLLGLSSAGMAFSLCVFGNLSSVIEGAQTILVTSFLPTLSDWGGREYISSMIVDSEAAIQGSIIFGLATLVVSLPGLIIAFTDRQLKKATLRSIWDKLMDKPALHED